MFFYYLKFAFRNLRFNPFFAIVNISGLGLGIASCIAIFGYLVHEWSYDTFHHHSEKIYRVKQENLQKENAAVQSVTTFSQVGAELYEIYPGVEVACRLHKVQGNIIVEAEDNVFREAQIMGADTSFFKLFDFSARYGSSAVAFSRLAAPNAVVLSESAATRYFGDADPRGKVLTIKGAYGSWGANGYNDVKDYVVTAVLKDLPRNTHLEFDMLVSFAQYANIEGELANWGDSFYTYFKLKEGTALPEAEDFLAQIVQKYRPEQKIKLAAQPLEGIHLTSNAVNEIKPNGNKEANWLLAAVAVLTLVVAGTNYINLTVARLLQRQKETDIRKTYWASSQQVFGQLFTESFIINLLALLLALNILALARPAIEQLTGFDLVARLQSPGYWHLAGIAFVTSTLVSGVYPALLISRLRTRILEGSKISGTAPPGATKNCLLAFQFMVSVVVAGCALVFYKQMVYMKNKDLGMEMANMLVLQGPGAGFSDDSLFQVRFQSFKAQAEQSGAIREATFANFVPGEEIKGQAKGYVRRLQASEDQAADYYFTQVSQGFTNFFDIKLLAGRSFSQTTAPGQGSVVINLKACQQLGFSSPEEATGQKIFYRMNATPTIIGVVENFHQYALQRDYQPIIFENTAAARAYLFLKLSEKSSAETFLPNLELLWQQTFPGNPFSYFELEHFFELQYTRDNRFIAILGLFAFLAVVLACTGLFGLVFYHSASKVKEIGIRKVLGAKPSDIFLLLGKSAGRFVLAGTLAGLPLVWMFAGNWLLNYAFRIEITWWMLVLPAALLLCLCLAVVGSHSMFACRLNPADALRE